MTVLWQRSLEDARKLFREHVGRFEHATLCMHCSRSRDVILDALEPYPSCLAEGSGGVFEYTLSPRVYWHYRVCNSDRDKECLDTFLRVAEHVGDFCYQTPISGRFLPAERVGADPYMELNFGFWAWIVILFKLAWMRIPGSPLRGSYEVEPVPAIMEIVDRTPFGLHSRLEDCPFQSSLYAIDILLSDDFASRFLSGEQVYPPLPNAGVSTESPRGILRIRDQGDGCVCVERLVGGLVVNDARISGPSLARLFRLLAQKPGVYMTWAEVRRQWVESTSWKSLISEGSLRRYASRIHTLLERDGLSQFWRHSSTEVAWVPPAE